MKKVYLIIICLFFSSFVFSQVNVSLPTGLSGSIGEDIEVPINVSDLTGKDIISFQFKITFNSSVLTAIDVNSTGTLSAASGWSVLPNTSTAGEISVGSFGASALSGSGILVKLKFRIAGSAGASTNLTFSSFTFNSGTPTSTITNGSFSVTGGQVPVLNVTPDSRDLAATSGNTTFNVSNSGLGTMNWSAAVIEGSSWLSISSGSSGANSGTITAGVTANSGSSSRTGKIRITATGATGSPKDVTIIQTGTNQSNDVSVSIATNITGTTGADIEIPITVGDLTNKNIISYQFKLAFNSSVLNATDIITTNTLSAASGWTALPNMATAGEISVGAFGSNALSGNGTLLKIKFRVVGTNGTNTSLTFSSFVFNSGTPTANLTNGSFTTVNLEQTVLSVSPTNRNVTSASGSTTFDVSNSGSGTMNWSAAVTEGSTWLSISAGSSGDNSGSITANYTANNTILSRTGKIQITSSGATGSPKEVTITQENMNYPIIQLSVDKILFDTVTLNNSKESSFTIKNRGTSNLEVSQIIFDGSQASDYSFISSNLPFSIDPNNEKTVTVKFKPTGTGTRVARLIITNNDPITTEFVLSLRGIGKQTIPNIPNPTGNTNGTVPLNPILIWNLVTGASSYNLQISSDPNFVNIIKDINNILDTTITLTGLNPSTIFYWRIRASNDIGTSSWSGIFSFTIVPSSLSKPTLNSPQDKTMDQLINLTLKWNSDPNATSYSLQISKDLGFQTIIRESSGLTDTAKTITGLEYNTLYYWRVNSKNSTKESDWSDIWTFTTQNRAPQAFTLVAPLNNQMIDLTYPTKSVKFSWNKSIDPDVNDQVKYSLFILVPDFNISKTNLSESEISIEIMTFLKPSTLYKWYVTATDGKATVTSDTFAFKTSVNTTEVKNQDLPLSYQLHQNYPNPFNPETRIEYSILENSFVSLRIYDTYGKEIETLVSKNMSAGIYSINWQPNDLPSGVYYYKIQAGSFSEMKKMLYIR